MKRHFLPTVFVTLLPAALIGFGALPPRPIYAAGTVATCDEASLATALSGGGSER